MEITPGVFEGTFGYNSSNTDGIMVSGITGTDWTVIVDAVDFGAVNNWFASNGEKPSTRSDDLTLTLGREYRFTLSDGSGVSEDPVGEPEGDPVLSTSGSDVDFGSAPAAAMSISVRSWLMAAPMMPASRSRTTAMPPLLWWALSPPPPIQTSPMMAAASC